MASMSALGEEAKRPPHIALAFLFCPFVGLPLTVASLALFPAFTPLARHRAAGRGEQGAVAGAKEKTRQGFTCRV
ncbi:hypothetical protein GCM10008026_10340 [Chelatococcus composti]|nr:hypothetical protein GCM10008026_10340 [Chelatococcus composti]